MGTGECSWRSGDLKFDLRGGRRLAAGRPRDGEARFIFALNGGARRVRMATVAAHRRKQFRHRPSTFRHGISDKRLAASRAFRRRKERQSCDGKKERKKSSPKEALSRNHTTHKRLCAQEHKGNTANPSGTGKISLPQPYVLYVLIASASTLHGGPKVHTAKNCGVTWWLRFNLNM